MYVTWTSTISSPEIRYPSTCSSTDRCIILCPLFGKEIIRTKYAKFRAIKFKPLLVKGTIFEGGEKMTVWVSDDPNHIALRVESPLPWAVVKVDMSYYHNLRYPLSSLVDL